MKWQKLLGERLRGERRETVANGEGGVIGVMCLLNTVEEMVDVQENGNRQLGIHKENDMCVSELG